MNEKERIILMLFEEKYKALYELLYNNMLLPRTHEIDHEEEREAFDGSTRSLVQLHKENQISFAQFCSLSESQITDIIAKSNNLNFIV